VRYDTELESIILLPSPDFSVTQMVSFAGLEDQVTTIEGAFSDNLHLLDGKTVDVRVDLPIAFLLSVAHSLLFLCLP
jgi:hypothetical protein